MKHVAIILLKSWESSNKCSN